MSCFRNKPQLVTKNEQWEPSWKVLRLWFCLHCNWAIIAIIAAVITGTAQCINKKSKNLSKKIYIYSHNKPNSTSSYIQIKMVKQQKCLQLQTCLDTTSGCLKSYFHFCQLLHMSRSCRNVSLSPPAELSSPVDVLNCEIIPYKHDWDAIHGKDLQCVWSCCFLCIFSRCFPWFRLIMLLSYSNKKPSIFFFCRTTLIVHTLCTVISYIYSRFGSLMKSAVFPHVQLKNVSWGKGLTFGFCVSSHQHHMSDKIFPVAKTGLESIQFQWSPLITLFTKNPTALIIEMWKANCFFSFGLKKKKTS